MVRKYRVPFLYVIGSRNASLSGAAKGGLGILLASLTGDTGYRFCHSSHEVWSSSSRDTVNYSRGREGSVLGTKKVGC